MSLQDLVKSRDVIEQKTSKSEVQGLLGLARRSLSDAALDGLSAEGRFKLAYEAALQLSTVPLRCAGYRTRGQAHHWAIFHVLPEVMGEAEKNAADYFESCRGKRATAVYGPSATVSQTEADALLKEVTEFQKRVAEWLGNEHPEFA